MIEISKGLSSCADDHETLQKLRRNIKDMLEELKEGEGKIFKLRDVYQMVANINIMLGDCQEALDELTVCLGLFQKEKQKELAKQFVEDLDEFEEEWSEIEIKYNMALCYLHMKVTHNLLRCLRWLESCWRNSKTAKPKGSIGVIFRS